MLDMNIKKQFLQISVVAFVLSLVPHILRTVIYFFVRVMALDKVGMELFTFLNYFSTLVGYAIAPVLICAVFYFIGKKPDLKLELRPILLALLIGNIASFFIGSIVYVAILAFTVDLILVIVLQSLLTFLVADVLAALAGLSMGYIRRKKLTLSAEPELT